MDSRRRTGKIFGPELGAEARASTNGSPQHNNYIIPFGLSPSKANRAHYTVQPEPVEGQQSTLIRSD